MSARSAKFGALEAKPGPRYGFQTGGFDRFFGLFADSVCAGVNSRQRVFDFDKLLSPLILKGHKVILFNQSIAEIARITGAYLMIEFRATLIDAIENFNFSVEQTFFAFGDETLL